MCCCFGFRRLKGRLHPSAFQCSGSAEPPLRNSRPVAGTLRATRRAAQKGRGAILPQGSRQSKISILTVPSRIKNTTTSEAGGCHDAGIALCSSHTRQTCKYGLSVARSSFSRTPSNLRTFSSHYTFFGILRCRIIYIFIVPVLNYNCHSSLL